MRPYLPAAWFWLVATAPGQVYSSARAAFVALDDADYAAFREADGIATTIPSVDELRAVLIAAGLPERCAGLSIADGRMARRRAAVAELAARIAAGLSWQGKTLQIDEASQVRLTAAASLAQVGPLPAGFAWRMADNSALAIDAAGMIAMAAAAGARVYALRAHYWALADAIAAAADAAALAGIDVTAGWPA